MVHKNGVEIECDLFGEYIDIVIDMGPESGNDYEFEICSVAIVGEDCSENCDSLTEYERHSTVPDAIEVIKGGFPVTFAIEHIYPVPDDSEFDAKLRQKSGEELSFVQLEEHSYETIVKIAAIDEALDDYDLIIESYDAASVEKETLMTDLIKVSVKTVTLQTIVLTPGTPWTWKLPILDFYDLETLTRIDPIIDTQLQAFVSYDASAQEFVFVGGEQSLSLAN